MNAKKKACLKLACAVLSLVLCIGAVGVGTGAIQVGDYNNEAERDTVPFYEFDHRFCPHEKLGEEGKVGTYPNGETPGEMATKCARCGAWVGTQTIPALKIGAASLSLTDNLTINYKIKKSLLAEGYYTNPYVEVTMQGETVTLTEYREDSNYYIFPFEDLAPHLMDEVIVAVPYATCVDQVCVGKAQDYSIKEYCYKNLDTYSADQYAPLRTLLVDLLNYGAASQKYVGDSEDILVNAELTAAQKAWGTAGDRTLTSLQDTKYAVNEGATVKWKGAGLSLQDSVAIRFKIDATDVDGLYVRVINANGVYTVPSEKFVKTSGGHYVYFDQLNAADMGMANYATVYDANGPISNTICYSIESYAYTQKATATDQNLIDLIDAMIRYGDAAKSYVNNGGVPGLSEDHWTKLY